MAAASDSQNNRLIKPPVRPLLRTALAYILHGDNKRRIRLLLDSASTVNLIQRHIADDMALEGEPVHLRLQVAGGEKTKFTKERDVQFRLQSLDGTFKSEILTATTIKEVIKPLNIEAFNAEDFNQTRACQINDPPGNKKEVHLLVGEPYFSIFTTGIHRTGRPDEPGTIETVFGTLLCGSQPNTAANKKQDVQVLTTSTPNDIDFLWNLDKAGVEQDPDSTLQELEADAFMLKNTVFNEEKKRVFTALPWNTNAKEKMSSNMDRAVAMSHSMMRRHRSNLQPIRDAFEQLEKQGFSEKVPEEEIAPKDGRFVYYLEVHAVLRPERETTKVRLVMNAASKDRNTKVSLNECLHKGRNLISLIPEIILRFRLHEFAICMDISKMFHQIGLREDTKDKDAVRYVAPDFDNPGKVIHMRHTSLPFGLTCSPYQAIYILKTHLENSKKSDPQIQNQVDTILQGIYVDDTVISCRSVKETKEIVALIKTLFSDIGMRVHKMTSSNNKLLLSDQEQKDVLEKDETTVLGLSWGTTKDTLSLTEAATQKKCQEKATKRMVLSQLAGIYDVLGLSGPFTVTSKLLMQEIWEQKLDWDDPLPPDLEAKFRTWQEDLPLLKMISVPRWLGKKDGDTLVLAAFGDASLTGYASVIFGVIKRRDGTCTSHILLSKSRVAPKKLLQTRKMKESSLSITRLELCGQVLNAKTAEFVRASLGVPKKNVVLFCDSMVTLGRLQQGPAGYCQYVGNRVRQCLELFTAQQFVYVDTKANPADLSTHGVSVKTLLKEEKWWRGPSFLQLPVAEWGGSPIRLSEEDLVVNEKEKVKAKNAVVAVMQYSPDWTNKLGQKTNNWGKLCRILAYIKRMTEVKKEQRPRQRKTLADVSPISVKEFNSAETLWIKMIQSEAFEEEIVSCEKGELVKTSLKDAQPCLHDGLLCQDSRVKDNPHIAALPIILPKKNELVEKLVLYYHEALMHAPAETTYVYLRRRFLLQGGRQELKRILFKCKNRKCRPLKMVKTQISSLPPFRCDQSEPFKHVSFDICGPVATKHSCKWEECPHPTYSKAYIGVFTCNSTRYVHVEALEDMSAASVLRAFERTFARRGVPSTMISDQGRQILSVKKEFEDLWAKIDVKKVQAEVAKKGITWTLSHIHAPNENGLAESAVKLVKSALLKTFKNHHCSFKEFETALIQCELCINQRPLGYLREDSNDVIPVSPCDIVAGRKLSLIPDDHRKETKKTPELSRMMKHRQQLVNKFWRRFAVDYLDRLSYTRLWRERRVSELQPGAVVQIIDHVTPRGKFNLGVVTEIHKGRDQQIRAATVRLPSGTTTRRQARQLALFEELNPSKEN